MSQTKLPRVTIRMAPQLINDVDEYVDSSYYNDRSDFIRSLVRQELNEYDGANSRLMMQALTAIEKIDSTNLHSGTCRELEDLEVVLEKLLSRFQDDQTVWVTPNNSSDDALYHSNKECCKLKNASRKMQKRLSTIPHHRPCRYCCLIRQNKHGGEEVDG